MEEETGECPGTLKSARLAHTATKTRDCLKQDRRQKPTLEVVLWSLHVHYDTVHHVWVSLCVCVCVCMCHQWAPGDTCTHAHPCGSRSHGNVSMNPTSPKVQADTESLKSKVLIQPGSQNSALVHAHPPVKNRNTGAVGLAALTTTVQSPKCRVSSPSPSE